MYREKQGDKNSGQDHHNGRTLSMDRTGGHGHEFEFSLKDNGKLLEGFSRGVMGQDFHVLKSLVGR